jgi:hypothetical protein
MLHCYLDFSCTVYYPIHLYYCNATVGLTYEIKTITTSEFPKTITTSEFPKTNYSIHVTKDITAAKTEANICNIQVRSKAARLCALQSFQQNICLIMVCYKNEFTLTHGHTDL